MSEEPRKPADPEAAQAEADDDAEARAFIMSRRAKFVAAALAGAGLVAACGGETNDGGKPTTEQSGGNTGVGGAMTGGKTGSGGFNACLSPMAGGGYYGTGGWCLQPPTGGDQNFGGAGGFSACLSVVAGGAPPGTGGAPVDAGDDAASTGGTGGAPGTGGIPMPCLSPPQFKDPEK